MTVLLLDNRDSFVWNLAQSFASLGAAVDVVRSDRLSVDEIVARRPTCVVMSPGPGRPEHAGVCVAAVRTLSGSVPLLGVCLGHQAIGLAFGATIARADPCHGKVSAVRHARRDLFANQPDPLPVCRYHSLVVERSSLPPVLRVDAWTDDGLVMAVRHREHPTFGVQFHPESFRTEHGTALLASFLGCLP